MKYTANNHTFVIVAYKECRYLEECVSSVMKQTVLGSVIIVTSTPNEYISDIADRHGIKVIANPGGGSISLDWNYAYSQAKTELITLMHQDDLLNPHYLEYVIERLNKERHPLIAFTDNCEYFDGKPQNSKLSKVKRLMLVPLIPRMFSNSRFVRRRILALGNAICCPSVTYVKDNLPKVLFKDDFKSNLDWECWEMLSRRKGGFAYVNKVLFYHRIHNDATTMAMINSNGRQKEDYMMFRRFWPGWIASILMHFYGKSSTIYKEKK